MKDQRNSNNEKARMPQKRNALNSTPKSVLEAFEHIVDLANNTNFSEEFFNAALPYVRYASRKLKLTHMQTVFLALFVDRSEDPIISLSDIAGYVGCRTTRLLRLSKDVDALEDLRYIIASRSCNRISYRVPQEVLKAIKNDEPYTYEISPITDLQSFFDFFHDLMCQMRDNELTYRRLLEQTMEGLDAIKDSVYAKTLNRVLPHDNEKILFTYMSLLFLENNDDRITFNDIDNLFEDNRIPYWCREVLRCHKSPLFRSNLIENVNEDGMACTDTFKLTDTAKTELLGEKILSNTGKSHNGMIKHGTFSKKKLIYNPKEDEQISELASILSKRRFKDVQERLEEAGLRKGFCCLFYGQPGTGKTETVYQLALRSGRDIMRVDVDKIKSCWVGESEKNIKALFDTYRNICRTSELAPILLFNEADAVLGMRMEGASRAIDKMENSIQNIILQEMETLEGIMIATTNLTTNLDKAFERRFLYKVYFEKPTVEARAKIWKSMLPKLSKAEANLLASESDLSGGEIENIVRKLTVNSILSGKDTIDISTIRRLCQTERIGSNRARIGF